MNSQIQSTLEALEAPNLIRDAHGKPVVGLDASSLYSFGHLIRCTERLLLDLFSEGLLSGTTHTCIGQELCQMSVVRALTHPDDAAYRITGITGIFLLIRAISPGWSPKSWAASGVCAGESAEASIWLTAIFTVMACRPA